MQHAPLGELLIQHGGMRQEHLQAALAEQAATGRPLGEIVVERGYVPAAMVAQALATQQGGLTKTEYGFATGWAEAIDERDRTIAELRHWAQGAVDAIASRDAEIDRLNGELESAGANDELKADIERLSAELASADELLGELRPRAERAPALERDAEELRRQLESESERVTALAADAEETERLLEGLRSEAAAAKTRADDVERAFETLRDAAEVRRDPWGKAESHLLFVRRPDGYELVERNGPPPTAGEVVDDGTVQRVAALGGTPCAYVID